MNESISGRKGKQRLGGVRCCTISEGIGVQGEMQGGQKKIVALQFNDLPYKKVS
jgi:hypothetical protein